MLKHKYPSVRITEGAKKRADEIVEAKKENGQRASITSVVSDAILEMPIPSTTDTETPEPEEPTEEYRCKICGRLITAADADDQNGLCDEHASDEEEA
jgi:hypothetical protein